MNTLPEMVNHLTQSGVLKTDHIIQAFLKIDRKDFVLNEHLTECYRDHPLPILNNQTISQPTTVAIMLELLQPKKGEHILDIGSGSGWTTALLAYLVGNSGHVWGIERHPELVKFGIKNLNKYNVPQAKILQAGTTLGYPEKSPYEKILVSAASDTIPRELTAQLKKKGRMVIPVKHDVIVVDKTIRNTINTKIIEGFTFVPLLSIT